MDFTSAPAIKTKRQWFCARPHGTGLFHHWEPWRWHRSYGDSRWYSRTCVRCGRVQKNQKLHFWNR